MLSGKCGLVYCHMGAAKEGLQPLMDAVAQSDVPITQFLPTHVERTPELIDEGAKWIKAGGRVDLTCRTDEVRLSIHSLAGLSAWTAHPTGFCCISLKHCVVLVQLTWTSAFRQEYRAGIPTLDSDFDVHMSHRHEYLAYCCNVHLGMSSARSTVANAS